MVNSLELKEFRFKCVFAILGKNYIFKWNNIDSINDLEDSFTGKLVYSFAEKNKHTAGNVKITLVENGRIRGMRIKRTILNITKSKLEEFAGCL